LQPLLEQEQRRRLKKLWPADLIDGWRGFTHWRGPHHDTKAPEDGVKSSTLA
jgi:hypothetical protein